MKSNVFTIILSLVAGLGQAGASEPSLQRIHRGKKNGSTWPGHTEYDPVQKMHRRLAWALSTATLVLIVNVVAVVALVEAG